MGEQGVGCGDGVGVVGGSSYAAGQYHSSANTAHEGFYRFSIPSGSMVDAAQVATAGAASLCLVAALLSSCDNGCFLCFKMVTAACWRF